MVGAIGRRRWSPTGIPPCSPRGPFHGRRRDRVGGARRERGQFECHFVTGTPEIGRHDPCFIVPEGDDQKGPGVHEPKTV
jgi:hypothetical protein